jgi:hypothetical protein
MCALVRILALAARLTLPKTGYEIVGYRCR